MLSDDPLVPLSEVAARANVTEARVRQWIRDGELAAEEADGMLMVRAAVLAAAPYEAGIPVRIAFNRVRMYRFQARQAGGPAQGTAATPVARAPTAGWKPADQLLPAASLAALRAQLETLWIPEPPRAHRAEPAIDWAFLLTFAMPISPARIDEAFPRAWRLGSNVTFFVRAAADATWTYADSVDAPALIDAVELAVALRDIDLENAAAGLARIDAEVAERGRPLGATTAGASYPLDQAIRRVEVLHALEHASVEPGWKASLWLHDPAGYAPEAVQELLYAIGFFDSEASTWAWKNCEGCLGDSDILSAAHDEPQTITLSFRIPRVACPERVAHVALAVARALQEALGGHLQGEDGQPLAADAWIVAVTAVEARVRAAGLTCGGTAMSVL